MAVYTVLEPAEVGAFLLEYGAGELRRFEPIAAGIENTTYRVETATPAGVRQYVLTLFERDSSEHVAETEALVLALAARGVPCPAPLRLPNTEATVGVLRGKAAVVVPWLEGRTVSTATAGHLEALGTVLARLHLAGAELSFSREGPQLVSVLCPWARDLAGRVRNSHPELAQLLCREADEQEKLDDEGLPSGVIHGDLFLDNVLFDEQHGFPVVRGLLDFHLAGRGPWLFDLAVVLLDAAWLGNGVCGDLTRALLRAYRAERPVEPGEFRWLPAYIRRAALRFLCLRVERFVVEQRPQAAGAPKDPWLMVRRLELLRQGVPGAARVA